MVALSILYFVDVSSIARLSLHPALSAPKEKLVP